MKKLFVSTLLGLLSLILLASTVFAAPFAKEHPLPFKGFLQAAETYSVVYPILHIDAIGSGKATHLGRYTVSYQGVVDIPTLSGTVSTHFVSANGDSLYAVASGQATPTDVPNIDSIVEKYTITGGTGRFAGATGKFTMLRTLNAATGVTSGTFEGYIALSHDE